ncbi:hypothetical protein JOF56_008121 [Kibdelosporangium banguiense]|uniref:Uncharacterized protein n=1 Tax=Kibdelosporangium banguiense TaxID=1365924 RepID=A0ABS4TTK3_9PSEU|nr:hypothetical protein [Kibdelosporangium banguiense]MBP2327736.1 hypothetical protein [Kibdelosporangium banguiense]
MRRKVAVAGGVVLALVLVAILIFSGDRERQPVSLSVPIPSAEEPTFTPSRPLTMVTIIPPAAPITTTPTSSTKPTTPPTRAEQQAPVPNAQGRINYYGARTNEPRGSRAIAYPNVLHGQAGGTGTFDDPLTFAAGEDKYKPGTKIYVPEVKRYFILEDLCPQCSGASVNLWAGPANDQGLVDCTKSLARQGDRPYVVNPPAGLPVTAGDLYQSGRCYQLT